MPFCYAKAKNSVFSMFRTVSHGRGMITVRKAGDRGHARHGWLESHHTFSFADYHDPAWMGYRSLRVINDDRVAPGMGFGTHPHRDMEIITYVLSGSLQHQDSMGNGRTIGPGEVQYMSAGRGIRHSEVNPSSTEPVHFLQIWIQPDELGVTPRYAEKSFVSTPKGGFNLVTSKTGRDGSIAIHQDADLWLARLDKGQSASYALPVGRHARMHVAEGEVTIAGKALSAGDALAMDVASKLEFLAQQPSQVLLFDLK